MTNRVLSRRRILEGFGGAVAWTAVSEGIAAQPDTEAETPAASWPATGGNTAPASPRTYLAEIVKLLQVEWPRNRTVNIVCHGHSVPAGYFKTPVVDTFNAYPHLLHRGLKERFPHAVVNAIVTAIGGESADAGADRFARDVLTHRPEVVTIDYGLNDRRIGLEKAARAWTQMVVQARERGARLILLTPTPDVGAQLEHEDDPLLRHAAQIRALSERLGVALVDSLVAFQREMRAGTRLADLMSQSNHPNRRGHELVARELLKWFEPPIQGPGPGP